MAKQTSIIKLQGTFQEVTYVHSGAYGNHVRAPRGTYKPAPVNATMKKEGKMVLMANLPAKIFKDAIDPYRHDKGGKLWQRLVSLFRKQLKTNGQFDFAQLAPFDIHEDFPMKRFVTLQLTCKPDKKTSKLQIEISSDNHPQFKKRKIDPANGYMLTAIGVFPDLKKKTARTNTIASPIRKLSGPFTPVILELDFPPKSKEYVVCLKLEACVDGVVDKGRVTTALCVMGGGKI